MIEVQHFEVIKAPYPTPIKNGCKGTKNFNTEGKKCEKFFTVPDSL